MEKLKILFEDNHLLIVDKPAGTLVQGDATGDVPLVEACKAYIKKKYHKPGAVFLGVVHRLDRPVSGVVVFARTSKALERMNKLFREKDTRKTYRAIVKGRPAVPEGQLVHWLVKDESKNKTTAYSSDKKGGKRSELHFKLLDQKNEYALLEINPITGRPHQIRVQLASMGCAIVGDLKYGFPLPNADASICLHAYRLEFVHPVGKDKMVIEAALPLAAPWSLFR